MVLLFKFCIALSFVRLRYHYTRLPHGKLYKRFTLFFWFLLWFFLPHMQLYPKSDSLTPLFCHSRLHNSRKTCTLVASELNCDGERIAALNNVFWAPSNDHDHFKWWKIGIEIQTSGINCSAHQPIFKQANIAKLFFATEGCACMKYMQAVPQNYGILLNQNQSNCVETSTDKFKTQWMKV